MKLLAKRSVSHTEHDQVIHPKLRMMRNSSGRANLARSQQCACLATDQVKLLDETPLVQAAPEILLTQKRRKKRPKSLDEVESQTRVNVFVEFDGRIKSPAKLGLETGRLGNIVTAQVPLAEIGEIAGRSDVSFVSQGDPLRRPRFATSFVSGVAGNSHSEITVQALAETRNLHRDGLLDNGKPVLIGVIDVDGFDFSRPDFLDQQGHTRFFRIWDQGGTHRSTPKANENAPYDYGSELTADHLNAALTANVGVSPVDLEPQSQSFAGSHGTHVASIAGGNSGVCPRAILAAVLIDLPPEDNDRRRSFYDSTRLAHAIDYLFRIADELGVPASINISLGTNSHAHDASSALSRWADSALAVPGRSICVAAGNSGQEGPMEEGDLGFIMGRIHTSGRIQAAGLDHDIRWLVVGDGLEDISENELEIWYEAQDRISISIRTPGGDWIGPIKPQEFLENHILDDGSLVSVYSELYHPANGSNYMAIYLSPFLEVDTLDEVIGVKAGVWTVRLHGDEIRDGRFHGWIERDAPGQIGDTSLWRFPSFFAGSSNVDNSSVSSLACGQRIVSVANLDEQTETINITSSQGPTRDGRTKPEVAAPGTDIIAANGFGDPGEEWVSMTGTSMASPFVAPLVDRNGSE